MVLLPKKTPGVGGRREAARRWKSVNGRADELSKWEGVVVYTCEVAASAEAGGR